jgi:hypothetical protein
MLKKLKHRSAIGSRILDLTQSVPNHIIAYKNYV